jgi:oligopeptide/dipeptide ABC transporter ATP-binding protein
LSDLLDVVNLRTFFPTPTGLVRAVDGISLRVPRGGAVGIVGESGSGKSVLSLTVMGLVTSPPAIISADRIMFEGEDLRIATPTRWRQVRGNRLAMIFQDPMTSLNPFLTVGDQLAEPLIVHKKASTRAALAKGEELLRRVGIPDARSRLDAYPHQFSGGMRQRVMVAMAMACEPALIIADEPTTALDVTVQAQILDLMREIRETAGTAFVLITHDMGVAAGFCDEINVMYAGRVVERGPTEDLFRDPRHPYTKALLNSVPRLDDPPGGRFIPIPGQPPDLTSLPAGCAYAPRCPYVIDRCRSEAPALDTFEIKQSRSKACWVDVVSLEACR